MRYRLSRLVRCSKITGVITKTRVWAVLVLLALGLFSLGGVAAHADPPIDVNGEITDNAGVLSSGEEAQVQKALDNYQEATGFQLFVVYVKSFDGLSGAEWSDQTATKSGLGITETLLAIAVDDGSYGTAEPSDHPISSGEFSRIGADKIEPAISRSDWTGAAVAAADAYTDAADDSSLPWALIVIGGVLAAAAGGLLVHRVRRRYEDTHEVVDEHGEPVAADPEPSTEQLGDSRRGGGTQ